jgi:hypothetical protein
MPSRVIQLKGHSRTLFFYGIRESRESIHNPVFVDNQGARAGVSEGMNRGQLNNDESNPAFGPAKIIVMGPI